MIRCKGTYLRTSDPVFDSFLESLFQAFLWNPVAYTFPDEPQNPQHGIAVWESTLTLGSTPETTFFIEYVRAGYPKNNILPSLPKQRRALRLFEEHDHSATFSISQAAASYLMGTPYLVCPYKLTKKIVLSAGSRLRSGKSAKFCQDIGLPHPEIVAHAAFTTLKEIYTNQLTEKNSARWLREDTLYNELCLKRDELYATIANAQNLAAKTAAQAKEREAAAIQERIDRILASSYHKVKS